MKRPTRQQLADYRQLNNIIVPAPANFNVAPVFGDDDDVPAAAAVVPPAIIVVPPVAIRAPLAARVAVAPPPEHCPWELYCSGLLGQRPDTTWVPDTEDEEAASDLHEELRLARVARDQAELALYEHDVGDAMCEDAVPPSTPNGKLYDLCFNVGCILILFLNLCALLGAAPLASSTPLGHADRRRLMLAAAERRANLARVVEELPHRVRATSLACCCACHSMVQRLLTSPTSGYGSGCASVSSCSTIPQSEVAGCCGEDASNRRRLVLEHDDSAYGGSYSRNYSDGSNLDDSLYTPCNTSGCSPCNGHNLEPDADHLLCAEDFMDPELEEASDAETDIDIDLVSDDESDVKPYADLILPDLGDEYKEYSDCESDTRSVVVLRVVPGHIAEERRRRVLGYITDLD